MADKFKLQAIISVFDGMSPTLIKLNKLLHTTRRTIKGLDRASGGSLGKAIGLGAAVGLGTGAVRLFSDQFIQSAAAMESLKSQMAGVMGTAEEGKEALGWVQKFAEETPLTLNETADAFMLLKNSGIDPTNGSLRAIVDQAARVGRGHEQVMGVSLALTQAWQKQKLQGEEIMQLNERLIPVWDILSAHTHKTVAELQDLSKQGKLGRPVIEGLIRAIGKMNAGASEAASHTWIGITSTLSDRWMNVKNTIMDAGPFEWLKKRLERLNDFLGSLNTAAGSERLAKIGASMESIFNRVEQAVYRIDFERAGASVLRLAAGFGRMIDMIGGLDNFAMVVGGVFALPMINSLMQITALTWKFGAALVGLAGIPMSAVLGIAAAIAGINVVMGQISGEFNVIEKLWPQQWEQISNAIGGTIDNMIENILRKVRMLGPLLPNSWIEGTARELAEIDRRRQVMEQQSSADMERRRQMVSAQRVAVGGGIEVNFNNVPPGTRIAPQPASGGVAVRPNVGYRSFATGMP